MAPMDFKHTKSAIDGLISTIKSLPGETKVCMECTGRYYEPMATWLTNGGLFVSAVNPKLVKDFGDESLLLYICPMSWQPAIGEGHLIAYVV